MDMRKCSCGYYYDAAKAGHCPFCDGSKNGAAGGSSYRTTYVKLMFGHRAKVFNLVPGYNYLVGRNASECTIAVPEGYMDVSRVHCSIDTEISEDGQQIRVRDFSQNGMLLYDRRGKNKLSQVDGIMQLKLNSPDEKIYFFLGGKSVAMEVGMNV